MSAGRLIGTGLAAASVTLVMALLGFDFVNIALAAAAVATAGAFIGPSELGHEPSLPRVPSEQRRGSRHEVSQLAWSLIDREGRVREHGFRQVRAAAADRLVAAGIDPDDDDAVAAALGDRALRILRTQPTEPLPTAQSLSACLSALEHLEGVHR